MAEKINKPVHCKKCSKVLLVIDEEREFEISTKCPNCGAKMLVVSKKRYEIIVYEN